MIVALLYGAGVGVGLLAIVHGLWPGRAPLAVALARLERAPGPAPIVGGSAPRWSWLPVRRHGRLVDGVGLQLPSLRRDLAITDRAWESHLADKAALGLFGLALVPATATVMAAGGAHLPLVIPAWGTLVMSIALFFAPDLGVRAEAAARRRDVRHALGSFLDLVVVGLAGGSGVEGALDDAASVGSGWAYAQIRHALTAARVTRETPWAALARLGDELGVAELGELAALGRPGGRRGRQGPPIPGRQSHVGPHPCPGRCRRAGPGRLRAHEPARRAALRRVLGLRRLPRPGPGHGRFLNRERQQEGGQRNANRVAGHHPTRAHPVRPAARGAARRGRYSTETVVVTALLVALGVAAVGIITAAVLSKAKTIQP